MIPVKDTRESLYKLLKAEYVQIQEVARTSDHAPSRTFYLWRVDIAQVIQHVGESFIA
jgi:DNA-directed RNA polymerase III subunit RPC3